MLSLTFVILPRVLHQRASSSPSILVKGSDKPIIHSQKPVPRLNEAAVKEYCLQFIDWACDRQTARPCSLTRDNLKQTKKIDIFWTVFVFLL